MSTPSKRKALWIVLPLVALLAAVALLGFERKAETSPVAEGARLAEQSGCYACHGRSDREPQRNFRSVSGGRLRTVGLPTFWENGIESGETLMEWIRDGFPESEAKKHARLLIQMPAYGDGYLSESQIESIAAWILAEGLALTEGMGNAAGRVDDETDPKSLSPEELFALGDRLSRQQACYQCHGELGQGGVSNPKSFKRYIPGFFGADFRALTAGGDRQEIRYWIDHGRGLSLEAGLKGSLAKVFLDGQAVAMPAYKDLLSENEKEILVDFLLLLNEMGPLGVSDLESIQKRLSAHVLNEHLNETQ